MSPASPPDPDVIAVRPGEELDVGGDRAATSRTSFRRPDPGSSSGSSRADTRTSPTCCTTPGVRDYVLRRPPHGDLRARRARHGARVPRPLGALPDLPAGAARLRTSARTGASSARPFFVMERRHGTVVRREVPPAFGGGTDPVANRKLSEAVIDALVDFHAVDPAAAGLESLGRPEGYLERQVKGWTDRWNRARDEGRRRRRRRSSSGWRGPCHRRRRPTLVHNDWRLDNMAVASDDPARCVAVYDWDMCTVGDPLHRPRYAPLVVVRGRARSTPSSPTCRRASPAS